MGKPGLKSPQGFGRRLDAGAPFGCPSLVGDCGIFENAPALRECFASTLTKLHWPMESTDIK
jgi:hypothetical protein